MENLDRKISKSERYALKAATSRSMDRAGGPGNFTHETRVSSSQLQRYYARQDADYFVPVDIAVELDRVAEAPIIIEQAAQQLGYRLVPIDSRGDGTVDLADLTRIMEHNSAMENFIVKALSDGKVDKAEALKICQMIEHGQAIGRGLHDDCTTIAGREQ